jgi:flagellin-like protein
MFRKSRKALSPVIASIILIAVTVAVSVVVASWMGGISIGLMGNVEQATITNIVFVTSPADSVNITILNSGPSSVTLQSATIDDNSVSMTATGPTNSLVVAKGTSANVILTNSGSFAFGTQYTIKITTAKGNNLLLTAEANPGALSSQIDWIGDGSDGQLLVSSVNQVVNDYAFLTGNENAGETTITVNDATGFSEDDEILLVQIQNSSGGEAGTYEFKVISSISGNDITLTASLENAYYSGSFNKVDATATQIVRVPQYTTVTVNSDSSITAPAWDGYTGGIVVFRAEIVTINNGGNIDVSEKGYRGGAYGPSNNLDGLQGESYRGKGIGGSSYGIGRMNNKGGGGSYICGGGGEYAGGATNSDPWTGSGDTYARKGEMICGITAYRIT